MKDQIPSLSSQAYESWTEDQVWEILLRLCERDCPLPGMRDQMSVYRDVFSLVYEQMLREHRAVLGAHFRTPSGQPFVNPLNLEHLTRLLHMLSHKIFCRGGDVQLLDSLFFILKSRCHINLFYKQSLERFFFAFHALGAVLGYGRYGAFLVVSQGSTIGQNHNQYPELGDNVIVGPGATILGRSRIGNNVLVGAGALIVDQDVPDDTVVFGRPPNLVFRENSSDNRALNFDLGELQRLGEI